MKDDNGKEIEPHREARLRHWHDLDHTLNFIRNITNLISAVYAKVPAGSEAEADLAAMNQYTAATQTWFQVSANSLHEALTAALDNKTASADSGSQTIH